MCVARGVTVETLLFVYVPRPMTRKVECLGMVQIQVVGLYKIDVLCHSEWNEESFNRPVSSSASKKISPSGRNDNELWLCEARLFISELCQSLLCSQANRGDPPKKLASIAWTVMTTALNNGSSFVIILVWDVVFSFILPPLVSFKDWAVPQ